MTTTRYAAYHARLIPRFGHRWNKITTTARRSGQPPRYDRFHKFLSLPPEVRDLIYEFAMHDLPTRCHIVPWEPLSDLVVYPQTLPSICFTSKRMHKEGLHAWLRRTRLVVINASDISPYLNHFLIKIGGHQHVRMLSLHDVGTFGVDANGQRLAALVAACPGITRLHMDINTLSFIDLDGLREFPSRPMMRSPTALKAVLQLDPLTDLKRLRLLTLTACCKEEYIYSILRTNDVQFETAFSNLGAVLEEVFQKDIAAGKFRLICSVSK